jgi:hypothetical protein
MGFLEDGSLMDEPKYYDERERRYCLMMDICGWEWEWKMTLVGNGCRDVGRGKICDVFLSSCIMLFFISAILLA